MLIAAIGLVACRMAVVPHAAAGNRRGLLRGIGIALLLVTFSSFGILLSRTLEMNGDAWGTLWRDMGLALIVTHFGHIWVWRVPALAAAWFAWGWARRNPDQAWTDWLTALALATIMMTRSDTGHAADHGDFTLAVWADWAHLLAAGTWVGSLFGMSLVVFPRLRAEGDPIPAAAGIFQRLSTLSGVALAVLLAGGIYNAIHQLGSFDGLWTSRFGIILDVKIGIVMAMIAMGAHNRYVKLPRLQAAAKLPRTRPEPAFPNATTLPAPLHPEPGRPEPGIVRACARAVLLEGALGLVVIGAAANLIHSMPPSDMPAAPMHAASVPAPRAIGQIVASTATE